MLRCLGELDGDVGGGLGGAAATLRRRPGVRVEELAAVVAAVGHAGAVEGRVGPVQLLLSVALHEEVDGHHACTLRDTVETTPGLKKTRACGAVVEPENAALNQIRLVRTAGDPEGATDGGVKMLQKGSGRPASARLHPRVRLGKNPEEPATLMNQHAASPQLQLQHPYSRKLSFHKVEEDIHSCTAHHPNRNSRREGESG